jgi:tetratricopeptide (TPR) repeat protein
VLAIHRGYHHDLYDAFFLPVIAHRVTLGAGSADDIAWRIHEFVNLNLRTPSGAASLDDDPRPVLLRGYAFCDQAVLAFIRLLQEKDVSGRLTWLRRDNGVSPHTVSEVLLDGQWRVFDTLYGFVPRRPDGAIASVRDLVTTPALLAGSRAEPEWYRNASVRLVRGPERRKRGDHAWTFARQALVRRLAALAPDWAVDGLQDAYLALPTATIPDARFPDGGPAWDLFVRARHYHVLLRADAAEATYRAWLSRYGDAPQAPDVLYELGLLQLTQRRDPAGAIATFDTLLARHPDTSWRHETLYLKARAHETLGDCPAASRLYRMVVAGPGNGLEDARARIGHGPCAG